VEKPAHGDRSCSGGDVRLEPANVCAMTRSRKPSADRACIVQPPLDRCLPLLFDPGRCDGATERLRHWAVKLADAADELERNAHDPDTPDIGRLCFEVTGGPHATRSQSAARGACHLQLTIGCAAVRCAVESRGFGDLAKRRLRRINPRATLASSLHPQLPRAGGITAPGWRGANGRCWLQPRASVEASRRLPSETPAR
jgi:hypothetical protein